MGLPKSGRRSLIEVGSTWSRGIDIATVKSVTCYGDYTYVVYTIDGVDSTPTDASVFALSFEPRSVRRDKGPSAPPPQRSNEYQRDAAMRKFVGWV